MSRIEFEGVDLSEMMSKNSPCGGCPFASSGCAPCKPTASAVESKSVSKSPAFSSAFLAQARTETMQMNGFIRQEKWCSTCLKSYRPELGHGEGCPHCMGKE